MLALERRNSILMKLQEQKKVTVGELSLIYNVTEETIRRDLEKLHNSGLVIKSYGGAILNEAANIELPFNVRKKRNVSGKQKIAEIICGLIENGEHIFLDASTTSVFIAKAIKKKQCLTVITNSIEVLIELSDVSGWDIVSTGGNLNEGYLALTGQKAVTDINRFYAEKAIISCKGLDMEIGPTDAREEFALCKEAMIQSSQCAVLAVDSSKFNIKAFSVIENIKAIDIIVTDKHPGEAWLDYFEKNNIKCLFPK
ncbi:MAG: DeoR/GlpR family DNA-binding transcription regulator [Clostridiales bacterium]|jgi:DeoR/GlpR family transcriptional regulator of sugar metabolism|nr:DeoR/GlpR family DNA-binding transcription regulator [Clostridiales bacterium]